MSFPLKAVFFHVIGYESVTIRLPLSVYWPPRGPGQHFPLTDSFYNSYSSTAIRHVQQNFNAHFNDPVYLFKKSILKAVAVKTKITFLKFFQFFYLCLRICWIWLWGPLEGSKTLFQPFVLWVKKQLQKELWEKSMANVYLAKPNVLWMKPSFHTQAQNPTYIKRKLLLWKSELYGSHRLSFSSSCIIKSEKSSPS